MDGGRLRIHAASPVMLLGQVAEARCTQLVNRRYTHIAKIAKRCLG
jgi:amidase